MTYVRCAITATRALCAGNYRGACTAYFLMGGCLYTAAGLLSFAGAPVGLYSAILLGPVVGATRAGVASRDVARAARPLVDDPAARRPGPFVSPLRLSLRRGLKRHYGIQDGRDGVVECLYISFCENCSLGEVRYPPRPAVPPSAVCSPRLTVPHGQEIDEIQIRKLRALEPVVTNPLAVGAPATNPPARIEAMTSSR